MDDEIRIKFTHEWAKQVDVERGVLHKLCGEKQACCKCRFWDAISGPEVSIASDAASDEIIERRISWDYWCRRFPPTCTIPPDNEDDTTRFPITRFDSWCGEFQLDPSWLNRLTFLEDEDEAHDDEQDNA